MSNGSYVYSHLSGPSSRKKEWISAMLKKPRQERSRATVEAILIAAAHILSERHFSSFTTNDVAQRAGVSIGSLYQYFENKEALLSEITRRYEERLIDTVRETGALTRGSTIRETVSMFVRAHINARMVDPKLYTALVAFNANQEGSSWLSNYRAVVVGTIAEHLASRPRTADIPNFDEIAFVLFGAVDGTLTTALEAGRELLSEGSIERQLTSMITGYLVELTGHPADA